VVAVNPGSLLASKMVKGALVSRATAFDSVREDTDSGFGVQAA
jgi:hypothetical protein